MLHKKKEALQNIRSRQVLLARQCSDLILFHREKLTHEAGAVESRPHCKQFTRKQSEFAANTIAIQQHITLKKEEDIQT
ncbi:hypothetical protein [Candidatus Enterococcus clewellii]|uniref:Uncharacterized protein n=1 Tax=Candidatus Enterococcus clewellii TaxID=1834193 RepID=A0A242K3M7_9ENTE|nr:hypothetical protein [Enterococcus sp. 9E7_DIV0242]OTP13596.1 hypothetical protein A5888_003074 [Enterococcus sp. 9E7_DIV0242]